MSVCLLEDVTIAQAAGEADLAAARVLFRAYADWLEVDLCFQGFEAELAGLPGAYEPPAGRLLLARLAGDPVGCVGLRPLEPGICEMKRLYVAPGAAGFGLGRTLAERVIDEARAIGYRAMRLDTITDRMPAAQHLYRSLGFQPIPAYYQNPLLNVAMLELDLTARGPS